MFEPYTEEELNDWRKAGQIAGTCLQYGRSLIKKGASLLEVSNAVEEKIFKMGGEPAFPTQISCDNIAAHYCADHDDKTIFDKQLVCIDVGVHVNGCIGDNALTVDLSGENLELVKATRDALDSVSKILQVGLEVGEIGKKIHEVITSYGFAPIRNLGGHGIDILEVHTPPSIPNMPNGDKTKLQKGQIIAIEPFATTGKGLVEEAEQCNIFALVADNPVRSPYARQLMQILKQNDQLPFTTRWLLERLPLAKVSLGIRELVQRGNLRRHPPLIEVAKGICSQAEHTFLIEDKVEILTRVQDDYY